jgi:hypothetical protein
VTEEELREAIKKTKLGKAAGHDRIALQMIKYRVFHDLWTLLQEVIS